MRDKEFINGKYYRDEVNTLLNAKSKITARAIYNYITNPNKIASECEIVEVIIETGGVPFSPKKYLLATTFVASWLHVIGNSRYAAVISSGADHVCPSSPLTQWNARA